MEEEYSDLKLKKLSFDNIAKMRDRCRYLEFPSDYFSVFCCIYLCGPEHFQNPGDTEKNIKNMLDNMLDALDTGSHSVEKILKLVALERRSPVTAAIGYVCAKKTIEILKELFHDEPQQNIDVTSQLKILKLLYTNQSNRDHLIILYKYWVENS